LAVLETDACNEGGAAVLRTGSGIASWVYIRWQIDWPEAQHRHINFKELLVVLLALQVFARQLSGHHVVVLSDSSAACGILRKWSTADEWANKQLQDSAILCMREGITVQANHVPGEFEILADPASRLHHRHQLINFLMRAYGTVRVSASEFCSHALTSATSHFLSQNLRLLQLDSFGGCSARRSPSKHSADTPVTSASGEPSAPATASRTSGRRPGIWPSLSQNWPADSAASPASAATSAPFAGISRSSGGTRRRLSTPRSCGSR
jgi:hypothetical protein